MDEASFICARLIWQRCLWQDEYGRLVCSVCVPHGALRASYCQSTRPFGTHAALQSSVPSLCRPAFNCCATANPPATSLPPHRRPSYSTATQTAADCGRCMLDMYTTDCVMGKCNIIPDTRLLIEILLQEEKSAQMDLKDGWNQL